MNCSGIPAVRLQFASVGAIGCRPSPRWEVKESCAVAGAPGSWSLANFPRHAPRLKHPLTTRPTHCLVASGIVQVGRTTPGDGGCVQPVDPGWTHCGPFIGQRVTLELRPRGP